MDPITLFKKYLNEQLLKARFEYHDMIYDLIHDDRVNIFIFILQNYMLQMVILKVQEECMKQQLKNIKQARR